jgi:ABC-type uncharacterized transport system ATPase component
LAGGQSSDILQRIDLVIAQEIEEIEAIVSRSAGGRVNRLRRSDRWFLMGLALDLKPIQHRFGILDKQERRERILAARASAPSLPGVTAYDASGLVPGLTVFENMMTARPRLDRQDAHTSVQSVFGDFIGDGPSRTAIMAAGLQQIVGTGGHDLTASDRRAIALARGLLRRPKLLLIEALPHAKPERASPLMNRLRDAYPEMTIVAIVPETHGIENVDQAYMCEGGQVVAIDLERPEEGAAG